MPCVAFCYSTPVVLRERHDYVTHNMTPAKHDILLYITVTYKLTGNEPGCTPGELICFPVIFKNSPAPYPNI